MSKRSHATPVTGSPARRLRALTIAGLLLALAFPAAAKAVTVTLIAATLGAGAALLTPLLVAAAAVMLLRATPTTSRRAITAFAGPGAARVLVGA